VPINSSCPSLKPYTPAVSITIPLDFIFFAAFREKSTLLIGFSSSSNCGRRSRKSALPDSDSPSDNNGVQKKLHNLSYG
jgi:hypothetical protein